MNLPEGVTYNPGVSRPLIAAEKEALITIDSDFRAYGSDVPYEVRDRDFEKDYKRLFSDDYRTFDRRYHLLSDRIKNQPVYSGAEHGSKDHTPNCKLPNITVVPNVLTSHARTVSLQFDDQGRDFRLPTGQEVTLFGCTMGHWHENTDSPHGVQEIYEFQGYGALVIDDPRSDEVEFWVARDGDKVVVPQQCHMTLYNLDDTDHPLITLDFANPQNNFANKKLVEHVGPILMIYYTAHETVFVLNQHYINRGFERYMEHDRYSHCLATCLSGGVRLPGPVRSREVRIPAGTRLGLGRQIYEMLTGNIDVIEQFLRMGIRVRKSSPDVRLGGIWFGRPLAACAKPNQLIYHILLGGSPSEKIEDIPAANRVLHEGEKEWTGTGPRMLEPGRKTGERAKLAIPIVVEGSGDWVEKAVVPSIEPFLKGSDGPALTLTIVDDSRWHTPGVSRPVLPSAKKFPNIYNLINNSPAVIFLDKACPTHFERYQRLTPGIVFVVTPDYTHSSLCTAYLDRSQTIFVEKPFDANYSNVLELLRARGLAQLDTEIYALDHYRFYAWRLKESHKTGETLLASATQWLGGSLQSARFYMTEGNPVEPHRVRSLQFGLMLDMLPHCFAMLAFFGKLESVDELELVDVRRYEGAPIASETFAHVNFTFEDYSNNGWRVPCRALVGKGLAKSRKFFEVTGKSGNSVLICFGNKTNWKPPASDHNREVDGGIYFVDKSGSFVDESGNPAKNPKPTASLDTGRYKQLVADLVEGTNKAIICALPLWAGERIVHTLDRIWDAIQAHSPWRPYTLGELDC